MEINKSHFDWIKIIKEDSSLTPYAKYIAFYLSSFMNREKQMAWPSQKRMACEMSLGLSTIKKHLGVLIEAGYLVKTKARMERNTSWEYNVYEPDIPTRIVKNFIESHSHQTAIEDIPQPPDDFSVATSRPFHSHQTATNKQRNKQYNIQKAIPPTLEEVSTYCKERKNNIDPEYFLNYYNARGWKTGNTKIVSWKHCIITWEKKNQSPKVNNYADGAI